MTPISEGDFFQFVLDNRTDGDRLMAYAFIFGFLWALLGDEEKAFIQKYVDSKK